MSLHPALARLTTAVLATVLLAACSAKPAPPGSTQPGPSKKPVLGGTMNVGQPGDPDVLVPYFGKSAYGANVYLQIFGEGGLLRISDKNEPEAYFAKSWKPSSDNLTWTFTLRDDVKFQDGSPLTADDVVFSYNIPLDKNYAGTSKSAFDQVKEVKALDKQTVQITLKTPFAPFLFTTVTGPIIPKKAIPAGTPVMDIPKLDFARKPYGAGPYKFVSWQAGQYVELSANTDYFLSKAGEGPFIQTIRFKTYPEAQTEMAALQAGEEDWPAQTPAPQFVDSLKNDYKDTISAYDWDRRGFGMQTFNNEKFPTNDKVVRQALSMALNKEAILKGPLVNKATIPPGPIPPVSWAFDPNIKGLPYDPAAAAKALDDAGYRKGADGVRVKDGKRCVIDYYATKGNPLIEAIALQSKKDWTDLGFAVNVNSVDFTILLEKYQEPGDFNVTFSGFTLGVDPDAFYDLYHSSQAKKDSQGLVKGNNVARYINPSVDKLLEEARATFDTAKRKQLYSQFQQAIIQDAPHNWIYSNKYTDFVNKRIKGVVTVPGSGVGFVSRWYINEQ